MTERQKLFCETYIANGYNAQGAYYIAFPDKNGGKKANKKPSYPYILLKNPEIKQYIQQRREEIYNSLNLDGQRIAQELAEIAFAPKGDEIYGTQYKLKALELLSKNLGLQTQKVETAGTIEVSLEE